jgi:hypothetical protein
MIGESSVTLKWSADGKELISIEVDGDKISPEEFNAFLFVQDVGTEVRELEEKFDSYLYLETNEKISMLMKIIRLKTRKIKKNYC